MKIIAIDLDGTLLNEKGEVSFENKKALIKAESMGIKVIIATGRSYNAALKPLRAVDLHFPIICLNGAKVYSTNQHLLKRVPLNKAICQTINSVCQELGLYFKLYTNKGVYSDSRLPSIEAMAEKMYVPNTNVDKQTFRMQTLSRLRDEQISSIKNYDDLLTKKNLTVYKILVSSNEPNSTDAALKRLENESDLHITSSSTGNLEFNNPKAKKGIALKQLAKSLGIQMDEVMAIRNSYNDLSMLKDAGYSVAMGNAANKVKQTCNYVTKKNTENGVAKAIEEMLQLSI